jgi:hypothetical protein
MGAGHKLQISNKYLCEKKNKQLNLKFQYL